MHSSHNSHNRMYNLKLVFIGMLVGIANVIPGVSGGTIAVVLGVFDRLIDAVNNFYKDFRKHFSFLLPMGLGAVISILLFTRFIKFCLENYSLPTNLFFAGLVAGSLPVIYREANSKGRLNIFACLCGILVVLVLSLLKGGDEILITELTAQNAGILLAVGAIASAAMVIPGISGSFVLILLGFYNTVVTAVADFNIPIMTVIALGIGLGILLISKIIEILLRKAYTVTYSVILGLILASLFSILTDKTVYHSGVSPLFAAIGVALAALGFFIALKLGE